MLGSVSQVQPSLVEEEVNGWLEICETLVGSCACLEFERVEEPAARLEIVIKAYEQRQCIIEFFVRNILISNQNAVNDSSSVLNAGTETKKMSREIDESGAEAKKRQEEHALLSSKIEEEQQLLSSLSESRKQLEKEVQIASAELDFRKEEKLKALENAIREKEERSLALDENLKTIEGKIRLAEEKLVDEAGASIDKTLLAKLDNLKKVDLKIRENEEELVKLNTEVDSKSFLLSTLSANVEELKKEVRSIHASKVDLEQQIQAQHGLALQRRDEFAACCADLEVKKKELNKIQLDMDKMTLEISNIKNSISIASSQLEIKQKAVTSEDAKIIAKQERKERLAEECAYLEETRNTFMSDCAAVEKKKETLKAEYLQLTSQKSSAEEMLAELVDQEVELTKRLEEMRQLIAAEQSLFASLSNTERVAAHFHDGGVYSSQDSKDRSAGAVRDAASDRDPNSVRLTSQSIPQSANNMESKEYVYARIPDNHLAVNTPQPMYHRILPEPPVNTVTATLIAVQEQAHQLRGASIGGSVHTPRVDRRGHGIGFSSISRELYRQYVPRSNSNSPPPASPPAGSTPRREALVSFGTADGSSAEKLRKELRHIRRLAAVNKASVPSQIG